MNPAGCDQCGRQSARCWGSTDQPMAAEACTEEGHNEPRSKWLPLANVLAICWGWLTRS
jgi:hypothetical protein